LFFYAVLPCPWILEQLCKYGVGVAKGRAVGDLRGLNKRLHECVELLEELKFEKELDVVRVPGQVQVKRGYQNHQQLALRVLVLLDPVFLQTQQVVYTREDGGGRHLWRHYLRLVWPT